MKCQACLQQFNPRENAHLGHVDGDCVEVKTSCPHCTTEYYTFTDNGWVLEENARKLVEAQKPKTSRARRAALLVPFVASVLFLH